MARPDLTAFDRPQSLNSYMRAEEEFKAKKLAEKLDREMLNHKFQMEAEKFQLDKQKSQAELDSIKSGGFGGNSIQAQIGNKMRELGYSDQQIIQALTTQGVPLQDGGFATYNKVGTVGAPSGMAPQQAQGGMPQPLMPAPQVQANMGAKNESLPLPMPQDIARQADDMLAGRYKPGLNVLVEPGPKLKDISDKRSELMKQGDALSATIAKSENIASMIDKAKKQVSGWSAGYGSVLSSLPASDARDLSATLDTIKANMGFEELNQMRQNSPTGGALGAVTERELQFLQSVVASLDQAQSPQQLKQNLDIIAGQMRGMRQRLEDAYARDVARFGPDAMAGVNMPSMAGAPQNMQQQPAIDPSLLEFMTPEERALFQ